MINPIMKSNNSATSGALLPSLLKRSVAGFALVSGATGAALTDSCFLTGSDFFFADTIGSFVDCQNTKKALTNNGLFYPLVLNLL